ATIRLNADKKGAVVYVEGPTLTGELKEVDAKGGTITLLLSSGKTKEVTDQKITVGSDATIAIDDGTGGKDKEKAVKASKLEDLTAGALVSVKLSGDMKTAKQVLARGPSVRGTVKSVDAKKNTITVEVHDGAKGEKGSEKTFEVAKDAHVTLDGGG